MCKSTTQNLYFFVKSEENSYWLKLKEVECQETKKEEQEK